MQFDVLTIFPEMISDYCGKSILGRARKAGHIKVGAHDFRKFTKDKHGHVDDSPYGGGPGMVLQVQPIYDCLKAIKALSPRLSSRGARRGISAQKLETEISRYARNDKTRVVIMDPAGKKFNQKMAEKYSKLDRLVLIAGRYEGFDARIYKLADERVSVGDYVLAGGELPALTIIEAISRQIPGVLGNIESLIEETVENLKEYPQYTRPEDFMGLKVPKVLISGDHKKIAEWRKKHSG